MNSKKINFPKVFRFGGVNRNILILFYIIKGCLVKFLKQKIKKLYLKITKK